jgi:hypothetical protein
MRNALDWRTAHHNVHRLQVRIVKAARYYAAVSFGTFERPELNEGKLSRSVLRGGGGGNAASLPGEHRLFSEIRKTWAGCPLRTIVIVAQYIRETKTKTGLTVRAHLFRKKYATVEKISDEMMATLNITHHTVCLQWNYTIYPCCLIQ